MDEANKLRVSLGLEPLASSAPDQGDEAAEKVIKEKEKDAREAEEVAKENARKKAKKKSKLTEGEGLGSELAKATGGSAADWVNRSRALAKQKKAAEARAKRLAEQEEQALPEYDSEHLAGLKVAHTKLQFKEGMNTILTLKDSYILDNKEDTLENVDLVGEETVEKNKKIKGQKALYDVYDEEEKELLPQYKEEKEKESMRLTVDEDDKVRRVASIRDRLKKTVPTAETDEDRRAQNTHDLKTIKAVVSDYLPAEPTTFKKRRRKKTKTRKTAEPRKFQEDETTIVDHQHDHGSRMTGSTKQKAQLELAAKRKHLKDASYLRAVNKAEKQSRLLLENLENVFEDENDEELEASLERARRLAQERKQKALEKKRAKQAADELENGEEVDKDRARQLAQRVKQLSSKVGMENEAATGLQEILTATTEFCRGLGAKAEEDAELIKEEAAKKEEKKILKDQEHKAQEGEDMVDENEDRDSDLEDDNDDEEKEDEDDFMHDEPLVSGSVAQALSLAKLRGLLKEEVKQAGRSKDETYRFEDPAPNISIVHLDEFGRPMKPKEAFRKLSHVFHGRGPGPVKQEKKLRQFREEQKRGRILFGTRKSTLDKLVKRQKKAGEAYVLLDAKGKST